ncbi:MAG: hypothetical protein K1Y02_26290 [Candidatus Hydrogenedentes bacterium]|nr:hypothetical protein [Candidatus Hydrogenedentota bacterium]
MTAGEGRKGHETAASVDRWLRTALDTGVSCVGHQWPANAASCWLSAATIGRRNEPRSGPYIRRTVDRTQVTLPENEALLLAAVVLNYAFRCRVRAWQLKARMALGESVSEGDLCV